MADESTTKFSAPDPALGYLYQVRCALLWSLQRLKEETSFEASIETLDDVAFEENGAPVELLQTKLHKNRGANLTDASPDLWKTIRIWLAALNTGEITNETVLYLLTTENAAPGSIASYLKGEERNIEAASVALEEVARTSSNATNKEGYTAFLGISPEQRKEFIKKITIIDSASDMSDLEGDLKKEIYHAAGRANLDTFLSYLEGWWFRRSITQLQNINAKDRILSDELEAQMADLRDQFKQDSLPIADDLLNFVLKDEIAKTYQEFPFVHQVKLATENSRRIAAAIRDYHRAFEQRSRWQRQDLLYIGDLTTFEKELEEEWELVFAGVEDRVGSEATEKVKKSAAQEILGWVEAGSAKARIKPGVTNPFITRGSLHILADELKVGWHPEFKAKLQHLLEGEQ